MTFDIEYELDTYRGRLYFLRANAEPGQEDPEEFAVIVYYNSTDERIEIAKVDNAHGYTHFHKYYRRGEPEEEVDWGFWDAVRELSENDNWKRWAEEHDKKNE